MITVSDDLLKQTMQEVIDNFLVPKFISLGMNASGRWIKSLEARAENNKGEIWGLDYTQYLVNGRRPGKRPPISPLVSWVGYKFGLTGAQAVSAAYAVANKIAEDGTNYYPNGTDLLDVLQSKEVTQHVYNRIGVDVSGQLRSSILRMVKNTLQTA